MLHQLLSRLRPLRTTLFSRQLRFEHCEDRRMLAAMADVVFLVDESGSSQTVRVADWLADVVPTLQAEFAPTVDDIDARYGLVGFGSTVSEHANSYLVNTTLPRVDPEALFGDSTQFDTALGSLDDEGSFEDGWDAIEHAIAEYRIRPGAVPVFVLIQTEMGRATDVNTTLTDEGVLAALDSKNAILNSVVVAPFDTRIADPVFGVESPGEDGDGNDLTHTAYIKGTGTAYTTSTFDETQPAPFHKINGDNSGGTNTDDDYVRLAWKTDGAAWNVNVIADNFVAGGPQNDTLLAFNGAFVDSVSDQILRAEAAGQAFLADEVLLALNLGGTTDADAGAAGNFRADDGTYTVDAGQSAVPTDSTAVAIDVASTNSIPDGTPAKLEDVFQVTRGKDGFTSGSTADDIHFTINKFHDETGGPTLLTDGTYVVELFFAEIVDGGVSNFSRDFDVKLEDVLVLENYIVANDHARIVDTGSTVELDSDLASDFRGLVKRFQVEVTGGNGLQVDVVRKNNSPLPPQLNGVRILRSDAPGVENVIVKGGGVGGTHPPYSFDTVVGGGGQLATVPVGAADKISIVFSEDVNVVQGDLALYGLHTEQIPSTNFSYNSTSRTATWTFDTLVANDHYLVSLSDDVTDLAGNPLDGEWVNPQSFSTPAGSSSTFPSGDGAAGGDFNFVMTLLAGDMNLDGDVDNNDWSTFLFYWTLTIHHRTFVQGDFTGDGFSSLDDYALIFDNLGTDLTTLQIRGDLDGDFDVDQSDYDKLDGNMGMANPTYEDGDIDMDGDIDEDDLFELNKLFGVGFVAVA